MILCDGTSGKYVPPFIFEDEYDKTIGEDERT